MKYTIKKLAELAGISTRTLRYYDQIGLLKPNEINKSNYRIYDEKNVNKLQQIMFYRSLDFPLSKIKRLMDDPDFSQLEALKEQRRLLLNKQKEVNKLLTNIDLTIENYKGEKKMADTEKFAAFKKEQLAQNEATYGSELQQKYDADTIKQANQKYSQLTEKEFKEMSDIESKLITDLVALKKHPDLDSSLAQQIYQEHRQWLEFTWPKYTKSSHRGLVDMYLMDSRFQQYYDKKAQTPVAQLLHDVVYRYTK